MKSKKTKKLKRRKPTKAKKKKVKKETVEIALIIAILITVVWIAGSALAIYKNWQVGKDTVAWLDRAQVASNPADMQSYLVKCQAGMKKWKVTQGYAAIVFKTPENDMILITKALNESIDRCDYVKQFDRTSIEYQVALDDLRGQIRELNLHTPESWWKIHALELALWAWLGWIAMLAGWIAFAILKEKS